MWHYRQKNILDVTNVTSLETQEVQGTGAVWRIDAQSIRTEPCWRGMTCSKKGNQIWENFTLEQHILDYFPQKVMQNKKEFSN